MKTLPYKIDQELPEAGLKILEVVYVGQRQTETCYLIQYLCCTRQATLTHDQIRQRDKNNRQRCIACGRKAQRKSLMNTAKKKAEVKAKPQVSWPVPPSLRYRKR